MVLGVRSQVETSHAADILATIQTGLFTPLQPVNLAIAIDDKSVDLSWSPPLSNGGVAILDYVIEYKLTSGGMWVTYVDGVSDSTTATVTGLGNDTSYDFRVSAVNPIGQGPVSFVVTGTPGSPAQVLITGIIDLSVPSISASTRITNEGSEAYEYQYTWCVTNADTNLCGGGDDISSASAAKLIQPSENWDSVLTATVNVAGTYWFHLEAQYGSDTSYASMLFTAVPGSTSGSGGGGGSSSGSRGKQCVGGDLNKDKVVNIVDFSILLSFFNKVAPFKNPCIDINQDGKVGVVDFSILLSQWGKNPTPFIKPKTP